MKKITQVKKGNWISRLETARRIYSSVYEEISDCDIADGEIDHLASLTCEFDEAIAEIERGGASR